MSISIFILFYFTLRFIYSASRASPSKCDLDTHHLQDPKTPENPLLEDLAPYGFGDVPVGLHFGP